jgi:hypothetical protein
MDPAFSYHLEIVGAAASFGFFINVRFSIAALVKTLSGYVMPHSFYTPFCTG